MLIQIAGNFRVLNDGYQTIHGKAGAMLAGIETFEGTFPDNTNTVTIAITDGSNKRVIGEPGFYGSPGELRSIWVDSMTDTSLVIKCSGGDATGKGYKVTIAHK